MSLGVDLVPFKVCSFDCIFCQLGATTELTMKRAEYVPLGEVMAELDAWMAMPGTADAITLAGSGEPTLHTGFGNVIRHTKDRVDTPVVLLSNGSTMQFSEVITELRDQDGELVVTHTSVGIMTGRAVED